MINFMADHVLIFHFGTQKTGTTSLQNFLYNNRETLLAKGWDYPKLAENQKYRFINASGIFYAIVNHDNDALDEIMNRVLDCLKTHNVILSAECFWLFKNIGVVLNKLIKYYSNVKVVVYLRRQDQYLESVYNQWIKNGSMFESREMTQFLKDADSNGLSNYLNKLIQLEDILGDNLIVKKYERESLKNGDIILDFISTIGIDIKDEECHFKQQDSNMSLNVNLMEIKRIINTLPEVRKYSLFQDVIKEVNVNNMQDDAKYSSKIMSPELRESILKQHEEENIEIARRYFGDEELFKNKNTNIPYEQSQTSRILENLIKICAVAINKQEINLAFLTARQSNRKLAFFGAGTICKNFIKKRIFQPDVIIDNYVYNIEVEGIPVIAASSIENYMDYQIIITCAAHNEIEEQLIQKGLREGYDYIKWFNFSELKRLDLNTKLNEFRKTFLAQI